MTAHQIANLCFLIGSALFLIGNVINWIVRP
jgi:hypothetical protein